MGERFAMLELDDAPESADKPRVEPLAIDFDDEPGEYVPAVMFGPVDDPAAREAARRTERAEMYARATTPPAIRPVFGTTGSSGDFSGWIPVPFYGIDRSRR